MPPAQQVTPPPVPEPASLAVLGSGWRGLLYFPSAAVTADDPGQPKTAFALATAALQTVAPAILDREHHRIPGPEDLREFDHAEDEDQETGYGDRRLDRGRPSSDRIDICWASSVPPSLGACTSRR
jgi:hypothetical protein